MKWLSISASNLSRVAREGKRVRSLRTIIREKNTGERLNMVARTDSGESEAIKL